MIYTSYWAKIGTLRKNGIEPVAVSRGKPKSFGGRSIDSLAPTWKMLKMDDEQYQAEYDRILAKNDPSEIVNMLGDKDVALMCWEKDKAECHRSLIAEWLRKAGYDVVEYGEEMEDESLEGQQMTLF